MKAILLCAIVSFSLPAAAQKKVVPNQQTGYRIEYEQIMDGNKRTAVLYRKGAMFRQEDILNRGHKSEDTLFELYTPEPHSVVWSYSTKFRQAFPQGGFIRDSLADLIAKDGDAAVRKRFSIPLHAMIMGNVGGQIRPSFEPSHVKDNQGVNWIKQGEQTLIGFPCIRYLAQLKVPQPKSSTDISTNTIWVEPNTGLILKSETEIRQVTASLAPPHTLRYRVISLQPLSPLISRCFFELPAGTVAIVPELFNKVKLPKGVKRQRIQHSNPTIVKTGTGFK